MVNIYQFFKEDQNAQFTRKFASTHFFNYKVTKNLQIGVFESVVFAPKDTLLNRGYEVAYLNPFLFYRPTRSEEHTSELQSRPHLVCRLLLEKKKKQIT